MRHTERPMNHRHCNRLPHGAAVGRAVDHDANLVAQLRHQEPGAAEALVAVYGDRVYRLAVRITGSRSDAEEVAQDALLAAILKIDSFRGAAAFGSWIYRIAANAAYEKRRRRRHERHETAWRELVLPVNATREPAPLDTVWSPRLEDPALHGELRDILRVAIDALREGHRAIFLLHDVDGLSNLEIAEAFQMKVGTVKSRVYRARLFLRSRLATYLNLPEAEKSKASLSSVGGPLFRADPPATRDRGPSANGTMLHHVTRADSGPPGPVRRLLPVRARGQRHPQPRVCSARSPGSKRTTMLTPNTAILLPLRRFHSPHGGNGHDTPD